MLEKIKLAERVWYVWWSFVCLCPKGKRHICFQWNPLYNLITLYLRYAKYTTGGRRQVTVLMIVTDDTKYCSTLLWLVLLCLHGDKGGSPPTCFLYFFATFYGWLLNENVQVSTHLAPWVYTVVFSIVRYLHHYSLNWGRGGRVAARKKEKRKIRMKVNQILFASKVLL